MIDSDRIKREIDEILSRIVEGYAPQKVILFGSYAYGEPNEDSDLDLLIITDTKDGAFHRRVHVHRLVSSPHRTTPLELIVLTPDELEQRLRLGDQFIQDILSRGKGLYAT